MKKPHTSPFCSHNIERNEKWQHLFIWLGYWAILSIIMSHVSGFAISTSRSLLNFILPQMLLFYINAKVFMPRLLEKQKPAAYVIVIVAVIFGMARLNFTIDQALFHTQFSTWKPPHQPLTDVSAPPLHHAPPKYFFVHLFNFFLLTLFSIIYRTNIRNRELQKLHLEWNNDMLKAESNFLKSQINPHFLFNTLNNIYSLSTIQSPKVPEMILKLSDLFRFMLYETDEEKIPIGKEIEYIESYIELQKLKTDEQINLTFEKNLSDSGAMICPFLLSPFVENAFKHSHFEDSDKSSIYISIQSSKSEIKFSCTNTISDTLQQKDTVGGVGLDNVKKRLEVHYPKKHILKINQSEEEFNVTLTLQLT